MNIPYKNMAPTCVVLAMALFCCWPYATQAVVGDSSPASRLRKMKDSALSLADINVVRNPFRFIVAEPEDEPTASEAHSQTNEPAALQADDFRLDATMLSDRKSGAIINDHYYSTGDRVAHSGSADIRLVQIAAHQVTLRSNGHQLTLRYAVPHAPAEKTTAKPIAQTPQPATSKQLSQKLARVVRERNERGGKPLTLAELLFRSSRIANDLYGESKTRHGAKEQP